MFISNTEPTGSPSVLYTYIAMKKHCPTNHDRGSGRTRFQLAAPRLYLRRTCAGFGPARERACGGLFSCGGERMISRALSGLTTQVVRNALLIAENRMRL